MIIVPILTTSFIQICWKGLGECSFRAWEWTGWATKTTTKTYLPRIQCLKGSAVNLVQFLALTHLKILGSFKSLSSLRAQMFRTYLRITQTKASLKRREASVTLFCWLINMDVTEGTGPMDAFTFYFPLHTFHMTCYCTAKELRTILSDHYCVGAQHVCACRDVWYDGPGVPPVIARDQYFNPFSFHVPLNLEYCLQFINSSVIGSNTCPEPDFWSDENTVRRTYGLRSLEVMIKTLRDDNGGDGTGRWIYLKQGTEGSAATYRRIHAKIRSLHLGCPDQCNSIWLPWQWQALRKLCLRPSPVRLDKSKKTNKHLWPCCRESKWSMRINWLRSGIPGKRTLWLVASRSISGPLSQLNLQIARKKEGLLQQPSPEKRTPYFYEGSTRLVLKRTKLTKARP